jgi:hypothetical protein
VNAESCECLRGTLAEADVADALRFRYLQDVMNGIGDIMPSEVIASLKLINGLQHQRPDAYML